jgi:hypothetical protein
LKLKQQKGKENVLEKYEAGKKHNTTSTSKRLPELPVCKNQKRATLQGTGCKE